MKVQFLFSLIFLLSNIQNKMNSINILSDNVECSTTWATSLYRIEPPPINLSNNTLRQIIHISSSAEKIRIKLSNKLGQTDLEIKSITIADSKSQNTGEILESTLTPITFEGKNEIIIPRETEIYSDIFSYKLKSLSEITISIYFGLVPKEFTGHEASMTDSFIEEGNKVNNTVFSTRNKVSHYYFISLIEIISSTKKSTVVCFGDSITDGLGSTNNRHNRYPDLLAMKLKLNKETSDLSVVDEGITSTKVTTEGIERYNHDVLEIKGVKYIIMLYGVNDINWIDSESEEIISVYKKIINLAHKNNLYIYGCTILPYGRNEIWTEKREKVRKEVNEWIRNTKSEEGGFDAIFDFDAYIKDPKDETILYKKYDCGDGIHPSPTGYQRMVQAIDDLSLFTKEPNFIS